jgi:hypothetical protein
MLILIAMLAFSIYLGRRGWSLWWSTLAVLCWQSAGVCVLVADNAARLGRSPADNPGGCRLERHAGDLPLLRRGFLRRPSADATPCAASRALLAVVATFRAPTTARSIASFAATERTLAVTRP